MKGRVSLKESKENLTLCAMNSQSFLMILFFYFIFYPSHLFAEESSCSSCTAEVQAQYLATLESLEHHFTLFRWYEGKIRRLYYGSIWKARKSQLDPLSESLRAKAIRDEDSLMIMAEAYERASANHSSAFHRTLKKLENFLEPVSKCDTHPVFARCINFHLSQGLPILQEIAREFEKIFEAERMYRTEVLATAGKKNGLYPEDALESPDLHGDYYSRFEMDRQAARFMEDSRLMKQVERLRLPLLGISNFNRCCTKPAQAKIQLPESLAA